MRLTGDLKNVWCLLSLLRPCPSRLNLLCPLEDTSSKLDAADQNLQNLQSLHLSSDSRDGRRLDRAHRARGARRAAGALDARDGPGLPCARLPRAALGCVSARVNGTTEYETQRLTLSRCMERYACRRGHEGRGARGRQGVRARRRQPLARRPLHGAPRERQGGDPGRKRPYTERSLARCD